MTARYENDARDHYADAERSQFLAKDSADPVVARVHRARAQLSATLSVAASNLALLDKR